MSNAECSQQGATLGVESIWELSFLHYLTGANGRYCFPKFCSFVKLVYSSSDKTSRKAREDPCGSPLGNREPKQ